MSRSNKVNPDHYTLAGRLSPDDLARSRARQAAVRTSGPATKRSTAGVKGGTGKTTAPAQTRTAGPTVRARSAKKG